MGKPAAGVKGLFGSPTPATPFPSSDQKLVMLFDWWLSEVEGNSGGKKLAVCGLTNKGQHATRFFKSAPIMKRYDAYTLETADGIMVRIQGVVNKVHMHRNGFSPEVCNRFLVGFPYNWDSYANESFVGKSTSRNTPTSASGVDEPYMDSSSRSGYMFPPHGGESSIGRILDILNSFHGTPDDGVPTRDSELKKINAHTSMNTAIQLPSDKRIDSPSCLLEKNLSENEMVRKDKYSKLYKASVNDGARGKRTSHAGEGDLFTDALNSEQALGSDVTVDAMTTVLHNITDDLLLHKNKIVNTAEETGRDTQMAMLSENIVGLQKDKQLVRYAPSGFENVGCIPSAIEGSLDPQSDADLADLGIKSGADDVVPENACLLHCRHGENVEAALLKGQDGAKRLGSPDGGAIMSPQTKIHSGTQVANISKTKANAPPETSVDSEARRSIEKPKALCRKQKDQKMKTRIFLKGEGTLSTSKVDHDRVNVDHAQGKLGSINSLTVPSTGFSGASKQHDIDDAGCRVLDKVEQSHVNAVGDSIAHARSAVHMRSRKLLESETMGKKAGMNCSSPAPCESVSPGKVNQFEENLTRRNSLHSMEEILPTENADQYLNCGSTSTVMHKLKFNSREGHKSASVSREHKPRSSDKKTAFSIKQVRDNAKEVSIISGCRTRSRVKESKNRGDDDQEKEFSLEEVERTRIISVLGDQTFANDIKHKFKRKHHQEVVRVEANKAFSAPDEMQLGDGNESFNCAIKGATQSEILAEVHARKNKDLHADVKNNEKKSNGNVNQSEVSAEVQPCKEKPLRSSGKKSVWRSTYQYVHKYSLTRDKSKKLSIATPEVLNLRRSRSGRLLVPALSNWCQHIVYDADGSITGIAGVDMSKSPCTEKGNPAHLGTVHAAMRLAKLWFLTFIHPPKTIETLDVLHSFFKGSRYFEEVNLSQ